MKALVAVAVFWMMVNPSAHAMGELVLRAPEQLIEGVDGGWPRHVAISPDGKYLVYPELDGIAKVDLAHPASWPKLMKWGARANQTDLDFSNPYFFRNEYVGVFDRTLPSWLFSKIRAQNASHVNDADQIPSVLCETCDMYALSRFGKTFELKSFVNHSFSYKINRERDGLLKSGFSADGKLFFLVENEGLSDYSNGLIRIFDVKKKTEVLTVQSSYTLNLYLKRIVDGDDLLAFDKDEWSLWSTKLAKPRCVLPVFAPKYASVILNGSSLLAISGEDSCTLHDRDCVVQRIDRATCKETGRILASGQALDRTRSPETAWIDGDHAIMVENMLGTTKGDNIQLIDFKNGWVHSTTYVNGYDNGEAHLSPAGKELIVAVDADRTQGDALHLVRIPFASIK